GSENDRLPPGTGIRGRCRPHTGPPPPPRERISCARPPPTGRRHNAGRYSPAGAIFLTPAVYLPPSPTTAPPPSLRLSAISGSAAEYEDRQRDAGRTSSSIRDSGDRRTHQYPRPAHSSPSSASAPPLPHPALDAGCGPVGTHRRIPESPPRKSVGESWPRRLAPVCLPAPPRPTAVAVRRLSGYTLSAMVGPDTLRDGRDRAGRASDLPAPSHTPATLRHPLPGPPLSSSDKSFPAADRPSDGGARR